MDKVIVRYVAKDCMDTQVGIAVEVYGPFKTVLDADNFRHEHGFSQSSIVDLWKVE